MKITANQVTIARIVLLPIPAWMLLSENQTLIWIGLAIAISLGATDALDGYMARRDGPTVLGGLLDPVADKVFVAAFLLPIVGLGHCPWWVAASIFVRELLITSLRSSMAARKAELKTSKLGKIKTIVQMGGLALYVFALQMPGRSVLWLHAGGVAVLVLIAVIWLLRKRSPPFWIVAAAPLWAVVFVLAWFLPDPLEVVWWSFVLMALLTWVSGADYILGSARVLMKTGVRVFDTVRAFWSIAQGVTPALLAAAYNSAMIPALIGLSCALSVGGIDNLASVREREPIRAFLLATTIVAAAAGSIPFAIEVLGRPYSSTWTLYAAGAVVLVNVVSLTRAFIQHREVFKEST